MLDFPEKIEEEQQLEEIISTPSAETIGMFSKLEGDILFLGIAGKIGPSLARMAKRACNEAGIKKRIIGVSRFRDRSEKALIEKSGIETIQGDLLNRSFLESLPQVKNIFFLAGMKFGSEGNPALTWAMNTYLPALVADRFKDSVLVAFSTGCVYPFVPVDSGGSRESDKTGPVGEYAQSCLGRERLFEYGSFKNRTRVTLIRLNYAVELRYGVLTDIAVKVKNREPIDLSMGYFNVIWQGDANNAVLRSLGIAMSPAKILNITGEEIVRVRDVAAEFGKIFGVEPILTGRESTTALLNNATHACHLFGKPEVSTEQMIRWIAGWLIAGNRTLGKPTHYEVRDGKY